MKGVKILVRLTILVQEIKDVLYQTPYRLEPLHAYVQKERYFLIVEIVRKVLQDNKIMISFGEKA